MMIVIKGVPIPKPQGLKRGPLWKQPQRVKEYRVWQEAIRWAVRGKLPAVITKLEAVFFLPLPNRTTRPSDLAGTPHMIPPDTSNLLKGVEDALTANDQTIWLVRVEKRWDDGRGPRVVLEIE